MRHKIITPVTSGPHDNQYVKIMNVVISKNHYISRI